MTTSTNETPSPEELNELEVEYKIRHTPDWTVYECDACGALVTDRTAHSSYHMILLRFMIATHGTIEKIVIEVWSKK